MTRLAAKYADVTDNCTRCPLDQPLLAPDGLGSSTDAATIVLAYRCGSGHCWTRSYRRADLTQRPAKASAGPRRHVATRAVTAGTTTARTTIDADRTDEANTTRSARQPSPKTGWNPDRRAWEAR